MVKESCDINKVGNIKLSKGAYMALMKRKEKKDSV
jgi:hypothetical protein